MFKIEDFEKFKGLDVIYIGVSGKEFRVETINPWTSPSPNIYINPTTEIISFQVRENNERCLVEIPLEKITYITEKRPL